MSEFFRELRLDFIDTVLATRGVFNRADLCQAFGISIPQASMDVAKFFDLYPRAMKYDRSRKRFEIVAKVYVRKRKHPARRLMNLMR